MIKIGVADIDTSHPLAFAKVLAQQGRAAYFAVCNEGFRKRDEVEGFKNRFSLEKICESTDELAECSDVGFIQGCNWDKHLDQAMAFIRLGKPVFLDKPMVGNLSECDKLIELEKNGAKILGSSGLRYCSEVRSFLAMGEENRGKLLHIDVTVGVDEFNYAIHAVELICSLAESRALTVKHVGSSKRDDAICDNYYITFENGVTACYHCMPGRFVNFNVILLTTTTSCAFTVDNKEIYGALLGEICDELEGKESRMASVRELTDCIRVSLACKASKSSSGEEISIDSPALYGVSFDGYEFEKEYSAAAKPIYL